MALTPHRHSPFCHRHCPQSTTGNKWVHHHPPKCRVGISIRSSVVRSRGLDTSMANIHHYSVVPRSFTALKIPCAPTCASLLPQSLQTAGLSTGCIVLPFPECHIVEITQYMDFSGWLLSPSNLHFRSLHAFPWLDCSLVFSAEYPVVCVGHPLLFIHLLRTSWLLSRSGNSGYSCCKHRVQGFVGTTCSVPSGEY